MTVPTRSVYSTYDTRNRCCTTIVYSLENTSIIGSTAVANIDAVYSSGSPEKITVNVDSS